MYLKQYAQAIQELFCTALFSTTNPGLNSFHLCSTRPPPPPSHTYTPSVSIDHLFTDHKCANNMEFVRGEVCVSLTLSFCFSQPPHLNHYLINTKSKIVTTRLFSSFLCVSFKCCILLSLCVLLLQRIITVNSI